MFLIQRTYQLSGQPMLQFEDENRICLAWNRGLADAIRRVGNFRSKCHTSTWFPNLPVFSRIYNCSESKLPKAVWSAVGTGGDIAFRGICIASFCVPVVTNHVKLSADRRELLGGPEPSLPRARLLLVARRHRLR